MFFAFLYDFFIFVRSSVLAGGAARRRLLVEKGAMERMIGWMRGALCMDGRTRHRNELAEAMLPLVERRMKALN